MPVTPWKVVSSRYVIRDPWMTLRADHCEMASGVTLNPYYVQEPPDWVHVVAFDSQERILIIRQYRHGDGLVSSGLPCGAVESGEAPAQAARRELLEETGYTPEVLSPLPVLSPNPACYSNKIHAFVAKGAERVREQNLDETEEIEFEFLTIPAVLSLIDAGGFPQALHAASLFLALRNLGKIVIKT
jgi:8-oxo-dGTP pyrophosphatase MutT (NUDIX family)